MIRNSIVFKLWVSMTGLVVLVFVLIGVMQYRALASTYYSQQAQQLVALGRRLAASVDAGSPLGISMTGESMGSAPLVYVVDASGQSLPDGMWGMMEPQTPPALSRREIADLAAGRTVTASGWDNAYGQNMLSVDVPTRQNGKFSGAVVIREPLQALYANTAGMERNILLAGLAGLLLATGLSLLLSRSLARPLKQMIGAARAMARGDYSTRIKVRATDEVGTLATSLNTLAAELGQKVEDLERLNETRRDFVANVSHELRTPLAVIGGFTEAIMDGLARDENTRQRYLQNILDEVMRLRRLTNDLLDLRRLEQGAWTIEKRKPVDVTASLARVRETLSALAAEKGVAITVRTGPPLPPVAGDADRLEQVFVNLVGNAVQALAAGGEVTLSAARADRGWVELTVTDNGPGIDPADLPLIWERFYKGDKSRARGGGGTGLGLAIVRAIVEAHGGQVSVQSRPGEGATFRVRLPAAETAVPPKQRSLPRQIPQVL